MSRSTKRPNRKSDYGSERYFKSLCNKNIRRTARHTLSEHEKMTDYDFDLILKEKHIEGADLWTLSRTDGIKGLLRKEEIAQCMALDYYKNREYKLRRK